jgi:phosphoribulokinase
MQGRGYSIEAVTQTILRRMYDYVHYITPQFSRTHVNFQRVPTVDTSNPFVARAVPLPEESFVVIRLSDTQHLNVPYLLAMIEDSFLSRPDTIVVPGTKMEYAMQLILTPMIRDLVNESRKARETRS